MAGAQGRWAAGNHTVHHRQLSRLTPSAQRAEICGQWRTLTERFGPPPTLFAPGTGAATRPPWLPPAPVVPAGWCCGRLRRSPAAWSAPRQARCVRGR
ncbi:polysaccharide deacetylase family protein [Streptomyces sp. NPDC127178]|uniref:polysaccharide deacetylase family protein n=1 Tax=unclassified Streptomyces TaxID=2593676 RepID=UPI003629239B